LRFNDSWQVIEGDPRPKLQYDYDATINDVKNFNPSASLEISRIERQNLPETVACRLRAAWNATLKTLN
jgi:hypothetical protein